MVADHCVYHGLGGSSGISTMPSHRMASCIHCDARLWRWHLEWFDQCIGQRHLWGWQTRRTFRNIGSLLLYWSFVMDVAQLFHSRLPTSAQYHFGHYDAMYPILLFHNFSTSQRTRRYFFGKDVRLAEISSTGVLCPCPLFHKRSHIRSRTSVHG